MKGVRPDIEADLQAGGDAVGAVDEEGGGGTLANLGYICLEQRQPALKMLVLDAKPLVHRVRPAAVPAACQRDRGPEIDHLREVIVPAISNPFIEDRPQDGIAADFGVESVNQLLDKRFGYFRGQVLRHRISSFKFHSVLP